MNVFGLSDTTGGVFYSPDAGSHWCLLGLKNDTITAIGVYQFGEDIHCMRQKNQCTVNYCTQRMAVRGQSFHSLFPMCIFTTSKQAGVMCMLRPIKDSASNHRVAVILQSMTAECMMIPSMLSQSVRKVQRVYMQGRTEVCTKPRTPEQIGQTSISILKN